MVALIALMISLKIVNNKKIFPIIVGRTGLYLKALTQGLSVIPPYKMRLSNRLKKLPRT